MHIEPPHGRLCGGFLRAGKFNPKIKSVAGFVLNRKCIKFKTYVCIKTFFDRISCVGKQMKSQKNIVFVSFSIVKRKFANHKI